MYEFLRGHLGPSWAELGLVLWYSGLILLVLSLAGYTAGEFRYALL